MHSTRSRLGADDGNTPRTDARQTEELLCLASASRSGRYARVVAQGATGNEADMTTTDELRRSRRTRPLAVTVSIVLWAVWLVVGVVSTVVIATLGWGLPGFGGVAALVVSFVLWALVAAALLQVLRGSGAARLVLVVIAAFRAALSITTGGISLAMVLLSVVAAVLLFLPSARPWFRRDERVVPDEPAS